MHLNVDNKKAENSFEKFKLFCVHVFHKDKQNFALIPNCNISKNSPSCTSHVKFLRNFQENKTRKLPVYLKAHICQISGCRDKQFHFTAIFLSIWNKINKYINKIIPAFHTPESKKQTLMHQKNQQKKKIK